MLVEEIYNSGFLSKRSFNVCKENNIYSLKDLMSFYKNNNSFNKLPNCGRKSNGELIQVCLSYTDKIAKGGFIELKKDSIKTNLSRLQIEVISSYIRINTSSLSARSKNAISFFLNDNFEIKNFSEKILLDTKFSLRSIKNVGLKSYKELKDYISKIEKFYRSVSELNDEKDLRFLKNKFIIQTTYGIDKIPNNIVEDESIFEIVSFIMNNKVIFNDLKTGIILKTFRFYQGTTRTSLSKVASEFDLSIERIRQLKESLMKELFDRLLFIKNFKDDLLQKYNIDTNSNFIEINHELKDKINVINKTNFTIEFITVILSIYLSDEFVLIGNKTDVLNFKIYNSHNRHKWLKIYLINKKIVSQFDFNLFVNDIFKKLKSRISKDSKFNFFSYSSRYLNNKNYQILDEIIPINKVILKNEFDLYLDLNDNIVFKRNTFKQAYEYSLEALKLIGKPSKIENILIKIKELHPNYITNISRVRASINRNKEFVPIGRMSIFGLKIWEKEKENFKGGTIRSISKEFLDRFDEPKHITEITSYVLKFRPKSNQKSIQSNLSIDKSGEFIFYKGSKIGLTKKRYHHSFIELNSANKIKRISEENFNYVQ